MEIDHSIHHQMMEVENKLHELFIGHWLEFIFTFRWWVLLSVSIVPWWIWVKIVNKEHRKEIVLFGLLIMSSAMFADLLGWNFGLWTYPDTILPLCTPSLPINLTVLPVSAMILYQYFPKWKSFIVAVVFVAALFSFVAEPLLEWAGYYKELGWKHIYSFPIYILGSLFFKWLTEKI